MQSNTQFSLSQSGAPFLLGNDLNNATTLTVAYTPSILTQTFSVAIEGIVDSAESIVLDTFSGSGASGPRSVSLNVAFDSFRFVPSWTGAAQQFAVAVNVQSIGNGATFNAALDLPNVHTQ